jgi:hypothetical protein
MMVKKFTCVYPVLPRADSKFYFGRGHQTTQICAYALLDIIVKVVVSFMVMSGHDILHEAPSANKEFF